MFWALKIPCCSFNSLKGSKHYVIDCTSAAEHISTYFQANTLLPEHEEERSLIAKKTPWYQIWLDVGPRLGRKWSDIIYRFPLTVVAICLILSALCCAGWYNFS